MLLMIRQTAVRCHRTALQTRSACKLVRGASRKGELPSRRMLPCVNADLFLFLFFAIFFIHRFTAVRHREAVVS